MKKSVVVSLFAASVFSIAAHAATPTKVDPVKACFGRAQNQDQTSACYDKAIGAQKKRLNAAYNKLIAHRKDDPKVRFPLFFAFQRSRVMQPHPWSA